MNRRIRDQESKTEEQSLGASDLTLIRKYLAMSPTERLLAWYSAARLAQELQKHAPRPLVKVRELIADPKRRIPVEPIVMTPEELDRRIARGDQFFREIVDRGKVLYQSLNHLEAIR